MTLTGGSGNERHAGWRKDDRVGITIITGFLGSGKSTLIRRILTEDHGMRLVVVENEFGANATVEEAIVTQGVGPSALEQFIELPNGCICCAAQDDLTDALTRLLRARGRDIDHILVEASGLADPGPIAASFWVDEELETGLVLDAVVNVADAVNLESYLTDEGGKSEKAVITQKQLAVADLIILNKTDLVKNTTSQDGHLGRLRQVIRQAGSDVRIIETTRCQLPLREFLGIRAYDGGTSELQLNASNRVSMSRHIHSKGLRVGSLSLSFANSAFDASLLDRALGELLWEQGQDGLSMGAEKANYRQIWRMKALVVILDEDLKRIYQSVDTLFDYTESSVEVKNDSDCISTFIFIGRGLKEQELRDCISRAAVKTIPNPTSTS